MTQSGVYMIRNSITNEIYVGSSINLEKRKYEHFRLLRRNTHTNRHMQNSYNKYEESAFIFEILKVCEKYECLSLEQYFINLLSPKYNINPIAGSSLNVKHTKETIDKMRKSLTGHPVSQETREKMRQATKLMIEQRTKEEQITINEKRKKTMLENGKTNGNPKSVTQLSLSGRVIKTWRCSKDVQETTGINAAHISKCCLNKRKTAGGYKWKFE